MNGRLTVVVLMAAVGTASAYDIRLPKDPEIWEKTAAEELGAYLGKLADGNSVKVAGEEAVFHVGDTAFARSKGLGERELKDEEWVVRSFGRDVVIAGGGSRGTLYATYHFLEDNCGVRWWSDVEEDVPGRYAVSFEKLDATGKPAFAFRDIHFDNRNGTRTPRNAIRFRLNRVDGIQIPMALGGAVEYGLPKFVHTFDFYVPAAEHFTAHPEWFSKVGDKRVGGMARGQLCISNPDVRRIVADRLFDYIAESEKQAREHGWAMPKIYDISQNDNGNFCACEKCSAERDSYGLSGQYVRFLNEIAGELKARRPDLMLSMLAYLQAMEPPPKDPGIMAADNIIVRICDTRGNQAASILEPDNAPHRNAIDGWRKHAKNVCVWDYAITYGESGKNLPFPSEFHYGDLYRFYRDHGVAGVFWEHEMPDTSDMFELKLYLELKLMENPDLDCESLIERFMREYYGDAAPFVLRVRRHLEEMRRMRKAFVNWTPSVGAFSYVEDEDIVSCERMFDRAEESVSCCETYVRRVRKARSSMDRLALTRAPDDRLVRHNIPCPVKGEDLMQVIAAARERLGTKGPASTGLSRKVPPPPRFAARRFYDFYPDMFRPVYDGNPRLVDDDSSPTRRASRLDVDARANCLLPFRLAYWNATDRQETCWTEVAAVARESGYHWYRLGQVTVAPEGYVYMSRGWLPQLSVSHPELVGRNFDIWVSARFEGPAFRPGDTVPNAQYIDRVVLLVPEAK